MPDLRPHTPAEIGPDEALRLRRRRARSIVMAGALLLWALVIYLAVMFRIDNDIRHSPQPAGLSTPY